MAKTLPTGATEVGVTDLRINLDAWIQRVCDGAQVIVTKHGKPVARLHPYAQTALERLIADGQVRPPIRPKRSASAQKPIPVKGNVSDLVAEQRRDRALRLSALLGQTTQTS